MIGLSSLEIYISIINITQQINKIEHFTDAFDKFSFSELKIEL